MLETIREYAAERLEESGEAAELRSRHAEHFLALAELASRTFRGATRRSGSSVSVPEHDNFRAALDGLEGAGETQLVLRLAGALFGYWYQTGGHSSEGLDRLERALAADERPTAARARALNGAGGFAAETGAFDRAARWDDEALALHHQLGDPWGVAYSIFQLGFLAAMQRDWGNALPHFEESLEAFRELGDEHYALLAMGQLAWMCEELGDMARGRALTEDVLARAREQGNRRMQSLALMGLAFHAREEGRFDDALSLIADGYRIDADLGQRDAMADAISRLARVYAEAGEPVIAVKLLASSNALYDELGVSATPWVADRNEEVLAIVRGELDEAAFAQAWDDGRTLTADEAVALALGDIEFESGA